MDLIIVVIAFLVIGGSIGSLVLIFAFNPIFEWGKNKVQEETEGRKRRNRQRHNREKRKRKIQKVLVKKPFKNPAPCPKRVKYD